MSHLEKPVETDFYDYVKSKGGICLKQNPSWYANIPDRLILVPGGWGFLLELKAYGKEPRPGQYNMLRKLNKQRIPAHWSDDVDEAIEIYDRYAQ